MSGASSTWRRSGRRCARSITAQGDHRRNQSHPPGRSQAAAITGRSGFGYANLGALLMSRGLPYDEGAGAGLRGHHGLMTGRATQSARVADHRGPGGVPKSAARSCAMRSTDALAGEPKARAGGVDGREQAWDDAVKLDADHGYRNAQATVLRRRGTIGFMMDCDTTPGSSRHRGLVKVRSWSAAA